MMMMSTTTVDNNNATDSRSDSCVSPSSPPPSMELLAELNNEGASHLENSLFVEAIATLTSALSIAMKEDEDDNNNNDGDHSEGAAGNSSSSSSSTHTPTTSESSTSSVASQLRSVVAEWIPRDAGVNSLATTATTGRSVAMANHAAPRPIAEVASKPKKTRRRKHKRRNSFGSTSSRKEVSAARPSRRESRRNRSQQHPTSGGGGDGINSSTSSHLNNHQHRRRARSAMGRMSGNSGDNSRIVTQDILQAQPPKYVYPKPLRVMDRYNIPSSMELSIYVVYNLALAYQLQALHQDEHEHEHEHDQESMLTCGFPRSSSQQSSTITWSRIIQLYKLATDLVEQQQQLLEESSSEESDNEANSITIDPDSPLWSPTYTVALPNNLACAYHHAANGSSGNNNENIEQANAHWQQALSHLWCILDVNITSQVECFSQVFENAAHVMDTDTNSNSSSSSSSSPSAVGGRTATAA
jgi:hypothetical protein